MHFGQRPKMDGYGDYMLLVFYGARQGDGGTAERTEVHLVVSGSYIVPVRHARCHELDDLRRRVKAKPDVSEQYIVYSVLDALTDTFFPVLSAIDDEIDQLEDDFVAKPTDEQLQRVFALKRGLVALRRVVTPQRDLAARTIDEIVELPGLDADSRNYLRDVYDHLIRISDLIDSYRDLLTGAMDVYLSTVSNRLNVVMKQLTIMATIFLPITALTGFFGRTSLAGDPHSLAGGIHGARRRRHRGLVRDPARLVQAQRFLRLAPSTPDPPAPPGRLRPAGAQRPFAGTIHVHNR